MSYYIFMSPFLPTSIEELIGCTGYQGQKHTLEEMEAAIALGVADRFATFDIALQKKSRNLNNVIPVVSP